MGRPFGQIHKNTVMATKSPTSGDLYWAAGFLDGEGSFGRNGGASAPSTERVTASQSDRELLDRLSAMFGGAVKPHTFRNKAFLGTKYEQLIKPIWRWEVTGVLARGVMMTLYTLLSQRRKSAVRDALNGTPHPRNAT